MRPPVVADLDFVFGDAHVGRHVDYVAEDVTRLGWQNLAS